VPLLPQVLYFEEKLAYSERNGTGKNALNAHVYSIVSDSAIEPFLLFGLLWLPLCESIGRWLITRCVLPYLFVVERRYVWLFSSPIDPKKKKKKKNVGRVYKMNEQGWDDLNKVKSPQKIRSNVHLELADWMNASANTCFECWPELIIEEPACIFRGSAETSNLTCVFQSSSRVGRIAVRPIAEHFAKKSVINPSACLGINFSLKMFLFEEFHILGYNAV
jgi:hypothetical protein